MTGTFVCIWCIVTLEDTLTNEAPWKLSAVWQCTSRLVTAVKKLHEIGIFYLRWKGTCRLQIAFHFNMVIQLYSLNGTVAKTVTRKLSYRKDDRAMRPMYGCPENFRESLTTPTATFPEIFKGFCSVVPCYCADQI